MYNLHSGIDTAVVLLAVCAGGIALSVHIWVASLFYRSAQKWGGAPWGWFCFYLIAPPLAGIAFAARAFLYVEPRLPTAVNVDQSNEQKQEQSQSVTVNQS